ncbi:hypothetical protein CDAR_484151 [Caerostris darwini]|uniref:Uncharacterized protein n=1 Tax=Caerostris darwini TaxID=1538125 RepID=A0AAV4T809_9ARAC|nr:hypothetical protein CDAR_484151 [Caerostris darwini]
MGRRLSISIRLLLLLFRKDDLEEAKEKKRLQKKCLEWQEEKEEPNIVRSFPEGMFAMTRQRIRVRCSRSTNTGAIGCSVVATGSVDKTRRRNKIEIENEDLRRQR